MKNKYEMLNETKINEYKYLKVEISKNEKEKIKDRLKSKIKTKNTNHKKIAVATIPLVIAGGLILSSETAQAYIEGIGKQIEYFLGKTNEELIGYKTLVNKTISDKNVDITLNEIMLRDGELLLSLRVDDSKLDKKGLGLENDYPAFYEPVVQIGDMKFVSTGGGMTTELGSDGKLDILLKCNLDNLDTNNDGKTDIEFFDIIKNIDINKDYDVKIFIDKLEYMIDKNANVSDDITLSSSGGRVDIETGEYTTHQNGVIKGNWIFETKLNGAKMVENVKIHNIDKDYKLKNKNTNIDLNVKEVRVAPTTIKVKYIFNINKKEEKYMGDLISFILKDENGKTIDISDGAYSLDYDGGECSTTFEINRDLKEITLIPVVEYYKEKGRKDIKFKDQAIKLNLSK